MTIFILSKLISFPFTIEKKLNLQRGQFVSVVTNIYSLKQWKRKIWLHDVLLIISFSFILSKQIAHSLK